MRKTDPMRFRRRFAGAVRYWSGDRRRAYYALTFHTRFLRIDRE